MSHGQWPPAIGNQRVGQVLTSKLRLGAGGADLTTDYTYNVMGQLTDVSMVRGGVTPTPTRHFVYTGSDLTSATNPENGTVTYQYDDGNKA